MGLERRASDAAMSESTSRTQWAIRLGLVLAIVLVAWFGLRPSAQIVELAPAILAEGQRSGRLGEDYGVKLWFKRGIANLFVHVIGPGQTCWYHVHHDQDELVLVVGGQATVRGLRATGQGGEPLKREVVLGPGSLFLAEKGVTHEFAAKGEESLWCVVFHAPPFTKNHYLFGKPPPTDQDFWVFPEVVGSGEPPPNPSPGLGAPDWARDLARAGEGLVKLYPDVGVEVVAGNRLEARQPNRSTQLLLGAGKATVTVGGQTREVEAPAWIYAPRGGYTAEALPGSPVLRGVELQIPAYDLWLFWR